MLHSLPNSWPLLFYCYQGCVCMCAYVRMCMCNMYVYFEKHKLFSSYSITCKYAFRAVLLALDNHSMLALFSVRSFPPVLRSPWLPKFFLCCRWGLMSAPSSTLDVIPVQLMFRQPGCWDFMHVPSDFARRHRLAGNYHFSWLLKSSYPLFPSDSLSLTCKTCVIDLLVGMEVHNSAFLLIVVSVRVSISGREKSQCVRGRQNSRLVGRW